MCRMSEQYKCKVCGIKVFSPDSLCMICYKKRHFAQLREKICAGEQVETWGEEEVVCPWCGEINGFDDSCDEQYVEGEYDMKCCECERSFKLTTNVSITYDTERDVEE